ncbi:hypothetical protein KO505_10165 [Psychrosphaera sp. F3M07]|uniref:hypothetical protein n=1 Tax=Psychrosphaera sp. F3M07 TaxID=2841560 RepID=UPI001C09B923|nr:hypothetical protein [Psychrosphaera sp. F3M07]MBU2918330.1 hypothetical protein [Psychrosphaera sp. F3M07]
MFKKLLILGLGVGSFLAHSEVNNRAYSYIGFGVGELSYKESGTLSSGLQFETTPTTTNIFNYSGGYTPINKHAGFYINTVSTLSSSTTDEYWTANGSVTNGNITNSVDGIYQKNATSSTHNELDIFLGYLIAPGHQIIAGGSYTRTLMDRNSFDNGSSLDDFNRAHLTPSIGSFDIAGSGAVDVNENGTLELDELIATYGVNPAQSIVNFTETFTSVVLQAGYIYDSRFATRDLGLRWLGGVIVGLPAYYDVVNTSNPTLSFSDSFSGFNIKSYIGAGWRFTKSFGVVAKMDYYFRQRDEVAVDIGFSDELQRNRSAIIPENEIQYWNASVTAFWNFD